VKATELGHKLNILSPRGRPHGLDSSRLQIYRGSQIVCSAFVASPATAGSVTLRAQKGYSQERVARLADLSLNTVIRIESGVNKNPTIETLTKLAKALEVSVDDLI